MSTLPALLRRPWGLPPIASTFRSPAARRITRSAVCGTSMVASKFFRGVSCTSTVARVSAVETSTLVVPALPPNVTRITLPRAGGPYNFHRPAAFRSCRRRRTASRSPQPPLAAPESKTASPSVSGLDRTRHTLQQAPARGARRRSRDEPPSLVDQPCHVIHRGCACYTPRASGQRRRRMTVASELKLSSEIATTKCRQAKRFGRVDQLSSQLSR